MELLLKIPKDKPPFIGVAFTRVMEACELNQELVNEHHDKELFILFNFNSSSGLSFFISSDSLNGQRWNYKDLKFDKEQFENFLYMTRGKGPYTFAHVLRAFDQELIVDTQDKFKKFLIKNIRLYVAGSKIYDPGMRGRY